jgi:hypothetical protein
MIRTYPEILEDDSPVVDGSAVSKLWKLRKRSKPLTARWRMKDVTRRGSVTIWITLTMELIRSTYTGYLASLRLKKNEVGKAHRSLRQTGSHRQEDRQPLLPNLFL